MAWGGSSASTAGISSLLSASSSRNTSLLNDSEAGSVEQSDPGTVRVDCGDTGLDADLVVAADGIGSKVVLDGGRGQDVQVGADLVPGVVPRSCGTDRSGYTSDEAVWRA
ncbi:hypothetical protein [Streptomyces collinus]|uniref:hypothetical protein n=1 Tax=Streptomyces collinus TaxID=42684 RepID=UPI0037FF21C8